MDEAEYHAFKGCPALSAFVVNQALCIPDEGYDIFADCGRHKKSGHGKI